MTHSASDQRVALRATVRTLEPARLRSLLGPAEAQYAEQIVLGMQGAQGSLACGSTIVDGDANDLQAGAGTLVNFVWTDPAGVETGTRFQVDISSSSFVTEDAFIENSPATNLNVLQQLGTTTLTHTARAFAHVGHAPGHGSSPIAGDVVSNECSVTLTSRATAGSTEPGTRVSIGNGSD